MPTLADYLRLAPFSIEELAEATNSVLRARPRLAVSRRTVRYYVGEGLLPSPAGSPKFARYEAGHLVRLVGIRCLAEGGRTLEAVRREADRLPEDAEAASATVQGWVDALETDEKSPVAGSPADERWPEERLVRRASFGPVVVEWPAGLLPSEVASGLREALRRFSEHNKTP